jgi:hypothetical protein
MEKSKQYQEIINLGKKISKDFSSDQRNTTIKWIGNYIASLIQSIEKETNSVKKKELEKECFDTILKLWSQRAMSSNRIQPLGNYENVISVLNSLKGKEKTFDWQSYDEMDDPGPWGKFVKDIRYNYNDAIQIAIYAAINPEYLKNGKEWLKHENSLTNDERAIIKHLDDLLTKSDTSFNFILFEDDDKKKEPGGISKKTQILNKLDELIEKQNKALSKLKKTIEKGDDILSKSD